MTIIEVIKAAKAQGWDNSIYMCEHDGIEMMHSGAFNDPSFWQCLGKAMGWEQRQRENNEDAERETGYRIIERPDWVVRWHRFIDSLAEGRTAEEFFKDLNS